MLSARFTPSSLSFVLYGCALAFVLAVGVRAQDAVPPPAQDATGTQEANGPAPAYIALVDGAATVERDGQSREATPNVPFVPGDHLRTTTGRVEVLFPDGTALDVDQYSGLDLQSPTLMRLVSGRVILVVAGASDPGAAERYQIDTPAASARTDGAGEYRVAVLTGRSGVETELAVLRGSAALATERGSMPIRAGERAVARDNEAPSFPQAFNSARFDAFDQWSADQRNARTGAASSQYLPQDLQMYGGTLDRYGSWEYTAPYGYAWYPAVTPGWRPYYSGYWAPYQPWGWTWIGADFWSWPTHHYGRWGFGRNRWFWIPGRTWGPAWVSWASAPGFVSWCPLGFDGRPVFGLSVGFGNAWAGWTVVPRTSFGYHARVDRFAVRGEWIPMGVTSFVAHHRSPVEVPRNAPVVTVAHGAGLAMPRAGAVGNTVVSRQPIVASHQSATPTRPSTVDSRQSTLDPRRSTPAVPREFKQPLPDSFRVPHERAAPAASPPASYAVPRTASPPTTYPGRAYPGSGSPVRANPDAPYPPMPHSMQGAPRSSPPASDPSQRVYPMAMPAPPASIERQSAPPAPRADRSSGSSAPAPAAVPRSGPPPGPSSAGPPSGGPPSHSGGSGGSSGAGTSAPNTPHSRGRGR
jgi:hypothetical protein